MHPISSIGREGGAGEQEKIVAPKNHLNLIFFLFFAACFFLSIYAFFPLLKEINFWDEAVYLNLGRSFMEGKIPLFAQNPLVGLIYGLPYLLLQNSPYWLVYLCSYGRTLAFILMWVNGYFVSRELEQFFNPLYLAGLFFTSPLLVEILPNPSDSWFVVFSGLAFWQILRFRRVQQLRQLAFSSLFIGLSALCRTDGLILFVIFFTLVLFLSISKTYYWKRLLFAVFPFIFLVGGYLIFHGLVTGEYGSGIEERSYIAFEQGHELIFKGESIHNHTVDAQIDARRVFGTPEDNNFSVLRAINRNPQAYFERLKVILSGVPGQLLLVFNKKMALLIFLLAFRGAIDLLRKKNAFLLLCLALWIGTLTPYLLTFFREGYFRTVYLPVFILATIGFSALLENINNHREKIIWSVVLGLFSLAGIFYNKLAIYYGASLFLLGIWFYGTIQKNINHLAFKSLAALIFLCIAIILHGNYPSPRFEIPGNNPDEKAARYMMEHYPKGTKVGAGSPGVAWLAKMEFLSINGTDVSLPESGEEFHRWLYNEGIQVVYLDYSISRDAPLFWKLIEEQEGKGLELVFSENQGSNRIYNVKPYP